MSDIAKEAECSQSTVSLVLNASKAIQISDNTRQRVLNAARQLGYEPPAMRALVSKRPVAPSTHSTIGFVIDQLSSSPEGIVSIEGVRQIAHPLGHVVLVAETQNDAELEPQTLQTFFDLHVDLIIYACIFTRKVKLPDLIKEAPCPVVLLNCYSDERLFPSVVPSEIAGGQRATEYLITHGHNRIATITGEPFMDAAKDRLEGYRRALATADIPFTPDLVIEGDWSASSGFKATKKLLAMTVKPTAIFCQNDRMAIGCYEALKEEGLHIPQDISVIGYDDEEIARHLFPPLTTSVLPHRAMGRWAVQAFLDGVHTESDKWNVTKLECPLIERQSVAKPT